MEIPLDSAYSDYVVNIQGLLQWSILGNTVVNGHWVETEVLVRVCDDGGDQYRFGFNGQEKVNEVSGMGNHNTAEFWEYDTRLGRRWNVDPVYKYNLSNYSVLSNNPIIMIDPNGDDDYYNKKGKYLGSDGKGTAVRLMDIDALQNKADFKVFMKATKAGEVDVVKLRNGISREIKFRNDGGVYKNMYSDSKDGAERSASI